MEITESNEVKELIKSYPDIAQRKLLQLRNLIISTAESISEINKIEETLKWGEPSYSTKIGSTIRIDWKQKNPNQYSMYFNCKSKLIDTYKEIYKDIFEFKGNREIIFQMNKSIPTEELSHCIELALTYKKRKHLPLLGA